MGTFSGLMSGGFTAEDLFDFAPVEDVPVTDGMRFRESRKGYEFTAGGRRWRVTRDEVGHNQRLVIEAEKRDDEGSKFAEWKDGYLIISPLAKRGAFRPVGKPLVKERMDGLAGLGKATTVAEAKEQAAIAAAKAEHYARAGKTALARVWRNAAQRLQRELLDFLDDTARAQAAFAREQGLGGLKRRGPVPMSAVTYAMKKLQRQVKSCGITKAKLREGMTVEREHRDVTKGGIEKTARIAVAHLCERKDYYKRLKRYVEP